MIAKDNKKIIWSWALYDFANSAFTTLVVTFIYGTYFTKSIAPDELTGTNWWSYSISICAVLVAVISPFIGAIADAFAIRKRIMLVSTLVCVLATFLLFFPTSNMFLAIALFTVANVAFELGTVFCNAYLPEIASPKTIGKVSGFGWGLGYLGGLLALIIALFFLVDVEIPPFGLDKVTGEHIRATNILVSLWFLIFSIPFFIHISESESKSKKGSFSEMTKKAYRNLFNTFKEIKKYKKVRNFLIARLVYNDALITIFALGGIYASVTIGFSFEEILFLGIVLNVLAGLGAFLFGLVDDKWTSKRIIKMSIIFLMIACVFGVLAPELPGISELIFGGDSIPDWFNSKNIFWFSAVLIGFFAGPNQSSSRALMSKITPDEKKNEFFGFYAFSGKATAFLGPLLFACFSEYFDSQQAGLFVVMLMFYLGYLLFKRIVT
jgi:UMF1 family MFS transporter